MQEFHQIASQLTKNPALLLLQDFIAASLFRRLARRRFYVPIVPADRLPLLRHDSGKVPCCSTGAESHVRAAPRVQVDASFLLFLGLRHTIPSTQPRVQALFSSLYPLSHSFRSGRGESLHSDLPAAEENPKHPDLPAGEANPCTPISQRRAQQRSHYWHQDRNALQPILRSMVIPPALNSSC